MGPVALFSPLQLSFKSGRVTRDSMVEDKYIGLALAILSTMAIGSSFVITKKGLIDAGQRHGFEGDGFAYLKSPIWWGGIITMVIGEVANFAAYAFAPAILVTPLGALSVLIGAVLGSYFLKERLGTLGKLGCALCLIGSVIIVLHAPPDREIQTVDEILQYAIHPGKYYFSAELLSHGLRPCSRFPPLLYSRGCFRLLHDIQGWAEIWEEEPLDLHIDLLDRRISFSHVRESFRHCFEIDLGWQ